MKKMNEWIKKEKKRICIFGFQLNIFSCIKKVVKNMLTCYSEGRWRLVNKSSLTYTRETGEKKAVLKIVEMNKKNSKLCQL